MRYVIVTADLVSTALAEAGRLGVVHPEPRWNCDRSRAIITFQEAGAPKGSWTLDELEVYLGTNMDEWLSVGPLEQEG